MVAERRVIVVGAGIAGLTAAFRLQRLGCSVLVLERSTSQHVGGRMASVAVNGYHIDRGATLLSYKNKYLLSLIEDAGLATEIISSPGESALVRDRRVVQLRTGSARDVRHCFPTMRDYAKVMADFRRIKPLINSRDMSTVAALDNESVSGYAARRGLNSSTLDYFLDPLGVTHNLADPEQASVASPFIALNRILNGHGFFTFRQGAGFVAEALAKQLTIEYQAEVTAVEERKHDVTVTWATAGQEEHLADCEACVIATPPPAMTRLYHQLSPEVLDYLRRLEYAHAIHVNFCLDEPTVEKQLVLHYSRAEDPDVAVTFLPHNAAPQRVPAGKGLATTYLRSRWCRAHWDVADEEIVDQALQGLNRLGAPAGLERNINGTYVCRVAPATIIRRPGDYRALAGGVAKELETPARVFFAGSDYLADSSTNSASYSGEKAAERAARYLGLPGGDNAFAGAHRSDPATVDQGVDRRR
jgi:protoporphyrinogen oxidase